MSARIRVLLVDDSTVVRRLLSNALSAHPEIEVVGTAANGIIALGKVEQLQPDALILDVEMPEMDGITTLINLREKHPHLPVIMFSTLTERGANVTFDALAAGASDYVLKPSTNSGETLEGIVTHALVPKLIALTRLRAALGSPSPGMHTSLERAVDPKSALGKPNVGLGLSAKPVLQASSPFAGSNTGTFAAKKPTGTFALPSSSAPLGNNSPALSAQRSEQGPGLALTAKPGAVAAVTSKQQQLAAGARLRKPIQIIAIAASTGGPNALAEVLPRLPKSLPVPIVIVQHMPAIFTRCLADRLSLRSELKVLESQGGEMLMPGTIYIAPGNRHLELLRDAQGVRTLLTDGLPENSCRPAADVLFRSVVRAYGGAALCVVLTGMGQDGARGAREIHDAGGRVLVQSGPTCVIWGMPKAVEESGIAEAVVPLPEMAAAILQRVALGLSPVRLSERER